MDKVIDMRDTLRDVFSITDAETIDRILENAKKSKKVDIIHLAHRWAHAFNGKHNDSLKIKVNDRFDSILDMLYRADVNIDEIMYVGSLLSLR